MTRSVHGASKHLDGCGCVRCRGFERTNTLSVRHGAYSATEVLRMDERTREIADAVRASVPGFHDGYAPIVEVYAVALRRLELAVAALDDFEQEALTRGARPSALKLGEAGARLRRLEQDARGWANTSRQYAETLALTPAAAARVARDLGLAKDAGVRGQRALEEYLHERYGGHV
jgi:hypothetical protein